MHKKEAKCIRELHDSNQFSSNVWENTEVWACLNAFPHVRCVWIYDNSDNRDNNDNRWGVLVLRHICHPNRKIRKIRIIRILEIMASGEKLNSDFTDLNWYKRQQRQSMGRVRPICMSEMQGKAELWAPNLHQSYILHLILHPILHPKSPINTGR